MLICSFNIALRYDINAEGILKKQQRKNSIFSQIFPKNISIIQSGIVVMPTELILLYVFIDLAYVVVTLFHVGYELLIVRMNLIYTHNDISYTPIHFLIFQNHIHNIFHTISYLSVYITISENLFLQKTSKFIINRSELLSSSAFASYMGDCGFDPQQGHTKY